MRNPHVFTGDPDFVDSHVHIESSMVLPEEFGNHVLPYGTCAVIADPHEVVNVGGTQALKVFMEHARRAPIDVFISVPLSVPATPYDTNGAGKFLAEDMVEFLEIPTDMALACNRLKEIGGGYVIASEGVIIGELSLPAFGLMSITWTDYN